MALIMRVSLTHSILIKTKDQTVFLPEDLPGTVTHAETLSEHVEGSRPGLEHHYVTVVFRNAFVVRGNAARVEPFTLNVSSTSLRFVKAVEP
jgi:hypothetical protein